MALFIHERASAAYGAAAHLIVASSVDALACRIVPPILLALIVRPMAGLRVGSLAGLAGALVIFNVSLAGVLSACGAGARSSQEALAMGCLVVLFSALLSGFLVSNDDLPAGWEVLAWISPLGRGFEAIVSNEFRWVGYLRGWENDCQHKQLVRVAQQRSALQTVVCARHTYSLSTSRSAPHGASHPEAVDVRSAPTKWKRG